MPMTSSIRKILILLAWLSFIACTQPQEEVGQEVHSPLSIHGLQTRTYEAQLTHEKELEGTGEWKADLWSYHSDSLKVYALVHTPTSPKPEKGYPILIFGHGFHPDPPRYGVSAKTGNDWRPGDYYRGIPEAYAEEGYLTITPDYRGHNISEGYEFTQRSYLASTYYAVDVLHLLSALDALSEVDLESVFFMGHSMGGEVGLKMLLATDKIKAASLWAAVSATTLEQVLFYGKWYGYESEKVTDKQMQAFMQPVDSILQVLAISHDLSTGDPIHYLAELSIPLIIHHATQERSVPYRWSESLAAKLFAEGKSFELYSYQSENHLFQGENRKKAVSRDVAFFDTFK